MCKITMKEPKCYRVVAYVKGLLVNKTYEWSLDAARETANTFKKKYGQYSTVIEFVWR